MRFVPTHDLNHILSLLFLSFRHRFVNYTRLIPKNVNYSHIFPFFVNYVAYATQLFNFPRS